MNKANELLSAAVVLSAVAAAVCGAEGARPGAEAPKCYPVAILQFQERGAGATGYGAKVADILFAKLAASPKLYLVDRADFKRIVEEQELNLSGMVAEGKTARVGHLTGAKILLTGSVVETDQQIYLVVKIIGTETGRVVGASVKGRANDELATLAEQLAAAVEGAIAKQSDELVAKEAPAEDRIKALRAALGEAKRPRVRIGIAERHVGQATIDPAAETEFIHCCKECGFTVVDAKQGAGAEADVIISGEGFSEFAVRHENLVSVKARVEVKATDRATGKVLAADRQVTVVVDLAEQTAGKHALQKAALDVAGRVLPALVKEWNATGKKP